jgi:hypothetical protein
MIVDDVVESLDPVDAEVFGSFRELFKHCVKVQVQNVSDYYYTSPQEKWEPEDFPCVAPPWPLFWMEWKTATVMISDNPHPNALRLFRHEKLPNGLYRLYPPAHTRCVMTLVDEPEWSGEFGGARWVFRSRFFQPPMPGAYVFEHLFFVDPEGKIVMLPSTEANERLVVKHFPEYGDRSRRRDAPPDGTQFIFPHKYSSFSTAFRNRYGELGLDISAFEVMWLALSFCNCKNISVRRDPVPAGLRSARQRRGRIEVDAYRTIEIGPVKKMLAASTWGGNIQRALRMRRAHFKTYTAEKPLFGKHSGRYFWPLWLRSSSDLDKTTYSVKVPTEGGEKP